MMHNEPPVEIMQVDREPLVKLLWHGHETVEVIPRLLETTERIEISLPESYNHAIFRTLNPHAAESAVETLEVMDSDPKILSKMAKLVGLEPLSTLVQILNATHASVQILTPPTIVIDTACGRTTEE